MVEWHVTPDYIVSNWTDELLDLMITKMVDRKEREREARRHSGNNERVVDDTEMFNQMGHLVKVVKS